MRPARGLEVFPCAADEIGNEAARSAHGRGRDQGTGEPRHVVTDWSDQDDVRTGRNLSDGEHVGNCRALIQP
jgi:hypothetical protein